MATTKISSKVEESVWEDLQDLARTSHQSISGLLTEAIREYVNRKRVRPGCAIQVCWRARCSAPNQATLC
jgi:predicted transcriptional regulator